MLGDKIIDLTGKITGTRVTQEATGPRVEVSVQGTSNYLGIEMSELATYTSTMLPTGVLLGEGQGVAMGVEGDAVSWQGAGVGRPTGKGLESSWRYAITFQTQSPRLARLNSVVGVGEWETDEQGNGKAEIWEWK